MNNDVTEHGYPKVFKCEKCNFPPFIFKINNHHALDALILNKSTRLLIDNTTRINFLSAIQHVGLAAVTLSFPMLIATAAGLNVSEASGFISLSMLALGITTLLQVFGRWGVGSGLLVPACFTAIYLPSSLLAAHHGGLSEVAGLTMAAGITECIASRFLIRLRRVITTEVIGIVILMVGIILGQLALSLMLNGNWSNERSLGYFDQIIPGLLSFIIILWRTLWGSQKIKIFAVLIGMLLGAVYAFVFTDIQSGLMAFKTTLPIYPWHMPSIEWSILPGFVIGALACLIRSMGDIVVSQQLNDQDWKRPNFEVIKSGVLADGLGTTIAGMLGLPGTNTYSGSVGLSASTGLLDRQIGLFVGMIWILLAFTPQAPKLIVMLPPGILGAGLLYAAIFIVKSGINIISQRLLDDKRIITIGLAIIIGLSYEDIKHNSEIPSMLLQAFSSSLVLAMTLAMALRVFFNYTLSNTATHNWKSHADTHDLINFMKSSGRTWGARVELVENTMDFMYEFLMLADQLSYTQAGYTIQIHYDEVSIRLKVSWMGRSINLNKTPKLDFETDEETLKEDLPVLMMKYIASGHITQSTLNGYSTLSVLIDDH